MCPGIPHTHRLIVDLATRTCTKSLQRSPELHQIVRSRLLATHIIAGVQRLPQDHIGAAGVRRTALRSDASGGVIAAYHVVPLGDASASCPSFVTEVDPGGPAQRLRAFYQQLGSNR